MPKKNDPTHSDSDDKGLFHTAMQDVVPLAASDKTVLKPKKPVPRPQHRKPDDHTFDTTAATHSEILTIEAGDEWAFSRPGVSRSTLRRLKRGYWPIQGRLDLHGFTRDSAQQHLFAFLDNALDQHARCVLIIHGKGLSSTDNKPVLKNSTGNWLAQYPAVLAFCQAGPENGGGGAVLVLLKNRKTE